MVSSDENAEENFGIGNTRAVPFYILNISFLIEVIYLHHGFDNGITPSVAELGHL